MKKDKVFDCIMEGLSESLEFAKGDTSKARRMCVTVASLPTYRRSQMK